MQQLGIMQQLVVERLNAWRTEIAAEQQEAVASITAAQNEWRQVSDALDLAKAEYQAVQHWLSETLDRARHAPAIAARVETIRQEVEAASRRVTSARCALENARRHAADLDMALQQLNAALPPAEQEEAA